MIDAFLAAVPKVELHLHLVGSASTQTVCRLAAAHPEAGVPADPDALAAFLTFRDFPHFIEVYGTVNELMLTAEDIAGVLAGAALDLAPQQVRYVEMTVTPYMHVVRGMAYGSFVEGLDSCA
jgi:adenosine deaminase